MHVRCLGFVAYAFVCRNRPQVSSSTIRKSCCRSESNGCGQGSWPKDEDACQFGVRESNPSLERRLPGQEMRP